MFMSVMFASICGLEHPTFVPPAGPRGLSRHHRPSSPACEQPGVMFTWVIDDHRGDWGGGTGNEFTDLAGRSSESPAGRAEADAAAGPAPDAAQSTPASAARRGGRADGGQRAGWLR